MARLMLQIGAANPEQWLKKRKAPAAGYRIVGWLSSKSALYLSISLRSDSFKSAPQ
jgi:hypothetical protein